MLCTWKRTFAALILGTLASTGIASADPWTFGVMSDTQDTMGTGINGVSTNIIAAVNAEFIAKNVDFVVQVGDLTNNGNNADLQTRLTANASLTAAGIPFYGLRGNHEDTSTAQTFFNANYIPTTTATATVSQMAGTSNYTVTHNGTKIVLLDILTADSPTATTTGLAAATTWMGTELLAADHTQAFVFEHKNLLGQNHKDNEFGSSNDANPTQQNAYFATLTSNNVKYSISGHDHMYHRSIVTSPNGANKVQEIICASDSTKFYTASSGFSTREQTIADQQNTIGYYTYTVDGPKVTGKYFDTPKTTTGSGADGDIKASPVWTLEDTFGYSLNGKQVAVAKGTSTTSGDITHGSYVGITDNTDLAKSVAIKYGETGYIGTTMSILDGANTSTATAEGSRACADDLNTGWAPKTSGLASDILSLWGMNNGLGSAKTDTFALSMTYDPSLVNGANQPYLLSKDATGNWVKAVADNVGGTINPVGDRAYNSLTDTLGTYGYNSSDHTVWAVINHNSDFAAAVPEPSTIVLLVMAGFMGLGYAWRRSMK